MAKVVWMRPVDGWWPVRYRLTHPPSVAELAARHARQAATAAGIDLPTVGWFTPNGDGTVGFIHPRHPATVFVAVGLADPELRHIVCHEVGHLAGHNEDRAYRFAHSLRRGAAWSDWPSF